ncbi:hypothetical protein ACWEWQ_23080, partial [Streptomyces sp. NPDC003832]
MSDTGGHLRTAARWDPVRLGVHPAPGLDDTVDLPPTEYLPRPHDETLRGLLARTAAARGGVFVLLVGRSASGKTRAAYEAVKAVLPDWPVVYPADAEELTAARVAPRTVLWLDEAQRSLSGAAGERAARALARLLDEVAPLAVVGTMRTEHLRRLTETGRGVEDGFPHTHDLLTGRHTRIAVPDTLPADAPDVAAAAARDPRLAAAVRAAGAGRRVLQHLTVGPELVRRWEMGPDQWFTAPEHAVLTAAAEARRLGHASAVPAMLLKEAAAGFMDSTARATAGEEWFPAAIAALTSAAGPAPLIAERHVPGVGNPDSYRPDDYLEQHISRVRAHRAPPAEFWAAAVLARTPDDLHAFARAAERRRRYDSAATLHGAALRQGHTRARAAWALLRETTHGPAAAEETAAADPVAWAALAVAREAGRDSEGTR